MDEATLRTVARCTRPWLRRGTPVLSGLCKLVLRAVCPRGEGRPRHRLVVPFDGGLVHVDTGSALEYALLFRGCHEPHVVEWIRRAVRPGAVCLDVGANVGAHALVMARCAGADGLVLAFEPHPALARRLRENVALNGYRQVRVVEAAVSDADGEATLHAFAPGAFRQGISSLVPDGRAPDALRVGTVDGAAIERRFGLQRLDLVKVDAEGHDAVVVRSLLGALERWRPLLLLEYRRRRWEAAGASLADTLASLRALGYGFLRVERRVSRPLDEDALPDGCEIACVPAPQRGT